MATTRYGSKGKKRKSKRKVTRRRPKPRAKSRKPKRKVARRRRESAWEVMLREVARSPARSSAGVSSATVNAGKRNRAQAASKRWTEPQGTRCAICGNPGDHDGDGHPFEQWYDEPRGVRVVPRAPSPFVVRQVIDTLRARDELR